MLKRLLAFTFFIFLLTNAYAQSYTRKDLVGQWKIYSKFANRSYCIVFANDSTLKTVSQKGMILNTNYNTWSFDDHSSVLYSHLKSNSDSSASIIRFLNDSTLLRVNKKKMPVKIDTNDHEILVYRKVKNPQPLHLPTKEDLIGDWYMNFKKITGNHLIFTDEQNVTFTYEDGTKKEATYIVDFTKGPCQIDFMYKGTLNRKEAILRFSGDDEIRIAGLAKSKRPEQFTIFGDNRHFVKEPLAKHLIAEGK